MALAKLVQRTMSGVSLASYRYESRSLDGQDHSRPPVPRPEAAARTIVPRGSTTRRAARTRPATPGRAIQAVPSQSEIGARVKKLALISTSSTAWRQRSSTNWSALGDCPPRPRLLQPQLRRPRATGQHLEVPLHR